MSAERVVHVIDDDEAVRNSLAFLLDAAGLAVRTYESAVAFLCETLAPIDGCIVTDIRMPDMTGMDLVAELGARGWTTPVIVITGHGDVPLAIQAMKAGVSDFLEKPFDDEVMLKAIEAAFARNAGTETAAGPPSEAARRIAALSQRERQVLEGLMAGKANKVIAYDLSISPRTVEVYRANLMTKMQADSLSEVIRMAISANFGC